MKKYLKQEWKGMLAAFSVSIIVLLISFAYIYLIGSPITQARNKFNDAVRYAKQGDYITAKKLLEESEKLWWTAETDNFLNYVLSK